MAPTIRPDGRVTGDGEDGGSRWIRRRSSMTLTGCLALALAAVSTALVVHENTGARPTPRSSSAATPSSSASSSPSAVEWPGQGQAAYQIDGRGLYSSPAQQPVPIASVAKVMTAYLVLRRAPLAENQDGPSITVTAADVADTGRRAKNGESVVPVATGERLSEREALEALLLPSANNVALILARSTYGSVEAFVTAMNNEARRLGMKQTTYTDPSGLDDDTVSTAHDQILLAQAAMREPTFASLVKLELATIPVAGPIRNTDSLLGVQGFVGIKTGSDQAAGGCFMFRTYRTVDDHVVAVTGVVLGQRGADLIAAALSESAALANRIAPWIPSIRDDDSRGTPDPTADRPSPSVARPAR